MPLMAQKKQNSEISQFQVGSSEKSGATYAQNILAY